MSKHIKVALVGNMNNNFFSVMRYLNDLGVEARLFIFGDSVSHFKPSADTWNLESWENNIQEISCKPTLLNVILNRLPQKKFQEIFDDYDVVIGEGLWPCCFSKFNLYFDIYIPYSLGIEGTHPVTIKSPYTIKNLKRATSSCYFRFKQIKSLKKTKHILLAPANKHDSIALKRINSSGSDIRVPILYREKYDTSYVYLKYKNKLDRMNKSEMVVCSHSRHLWQTFGSELLRNVGGKGNDKLIRGFAEFVSRHKFSTPLLVLFDYGPDVDLSKNLINSLGIAEYVVWFPICPRKEIVEIIKYSDLGANEFGCDAWGGVGFEFLAAGKVFLQKMSISPEHFAASTGAKLPNIICADSASEIAEGISLFYENKAEYIKMGKDNVTWFEKYHGSGQAKKLVDLIESISQAKGANK